MASSSKFHPTVTITNVKSLITITLDQDSRQYNSWVTLFKIHAQVHNVINHIILRKKKNQLY